MKKTPSARTGKGSFFMRYPQASVDMTAPKLLQMYIFLAYLSFQSYILTHLCLLIIYARTAP